MNRGVDARHPNFTFARVDVAEVQHARTDGMPGNRRTDRLPAQRERHPG
jgi:hypothetical protein